MNRLTQLRIDALLSVDVLSQRTGVNRATIYSLERGDVTRPRMDTLAPLATFFDVPASELLRPVAESEAA